MRYGIGAGLLTFGLGAATVWYRGGSQSAQLLRDGEVDMIHMGHNRVESVKKSGKDVSYTFDGGTMDMDHVLDRQP